MVPVAEDPQPLVERASRGDVGALDSLLDRYLPGLDRFLRKRARGPILDKESGADLVQSVCREVLQHLEDGRFEYQGEPEFKQWLYRAAELKIKDRLRFYHRDRRDPQREVPIDAQASGSDAEALFRLLRTPSQQAIRGEELARFEQAFAALDERGRELITLVHLDGLSHREAAARLEIDEAYSRTVLARAMARLARLASEGRGP